MIPPRSVTDFESLILGTTNALRILAIHVALTSGDRIGALQKQVDTALEESTKDGWVAECIAKSLSEAVRAVADSLAGGGSPDPDELRRKFKVIIGDKDKDEKEE